jgi:Leucine Rich repeat
MDDSKKEKKLTSEECRDELYHAFLHTPRLDWAQGVINNIISRLGESKLKLENYCPNGKRKIAIKMLAEALESNKVCKNLSITSFGLKDEELEPLVGMLKTNKVIIALDLSYNDITDKGVKCLAEMLKTNKALRAINLFGNNRITDQGTEVLHDVLINYKNSSLDICYVKVYTDSIRFPNVKKITDHLEHRQSGAVSKYVAEAKKEIELCLTKDLAKIVLGYLPENERAEIETERKKIRQERQDNAKDNSYQDEYKCIKYKEILAYSPPFLTLPLLYFLPALSDKMEGRAAEWLRAHTGNSIFPNAITITLSLIGAFLIGFGLYVYFCQRKPDSYTPVPEPPEETKKYLVSI